MTERAKVLIDQARKLSSEERLEIADALLTSLAQPDADLDEAWLAEARDRLEAYRRGEIEARDFDEVIAKYTP